MTNYRTVQDSVDMTRDEDVLGNAQLFIILPSWSHYLVFVLHLLPNDASLREIDDRRDHAVAFILFDMEHLVISIPGILGYKSINLQQLQIKFGFNTYFI